MKFTSKEAEDIVRKEREEIKYTHSTLDRVMQELISCKERERVFEEKAANLSLHLTVSKQELKASQSDLSLIRETMRESHELEINTRSSLEYCIDNLEDERAILIKSHNDKNEQLKLEVFKEQMKR